MLLSLLAPAIYASNSFIDKYVLERKIGNPAGMPVYSGLAALILGTGVWLLSSTPSLSPHNGLLLVGSGVASLYALSLYFYALRHSHTSYIISLLQMTPVFTLALSLIFLDATISGWQLLAFFIILVGVLGLNFNFERLEGRLHLGIAFWAMLVANLLLSVSILLVTFSVDLSGFTPILIYQSWGLALGGLSLLAVKPVRHAFWQNFRSAGASTLAIMFGNETLFNVANATTFLAVSIGPAALVSVLSGTQVFYGLVFGTLLTLALPHIFKENISKTSLGRKIVFAALLFSGVALLSVA